MIQMTKFLVDLICQELEYLKSIFYMLEGIDILSIDGH